MRALTPEHQRRIRQYLPVFQEYSQSAKAARDREERGQRLALFQPLTSESVLQMDETDILGLITQLWATHFWKNQQYILDKIISSNGLDRLRKELSALLCGQAAVSDRYERFLGNIKHLGPASVTEMLASKAPDHCGIWNDKARKGLTILGFEEDLPLTKYQINGAELAQFNDVCR